jgi:hypothetical protein
MDASEKIPEFLGELVYFVVTHDLLEAVLY